MGDVFERVANEKQLKKKNAMNERLKSKIKTLVAKNILKDLSKNIMKHKTNKQSIIIDSEDTNDNI